MSNRFVGGLHFKALTRNSLQYVIADVYNVRAGIVGSRMGNEMVTRSRTPISAKGVTEADCELIRAELAKVVQSSPFVSSKRYPAFLTFVVEQTLGGHADMLKERTIGVEVFQRKPNFDTNSDTTVRFTAGEVRKRLATVYNSPLLDRIVQIELPVGSYIPEFFRVSEEAAHQEEAAVPPAPSSAGEIQEVRAASKDSYSYWYVVAAAVSLIALSIGMVHWWMGQHDALTRFWQPVISTKEPILLTLNTRSFAAPLVPAGDGTLKPDPYPFVSLSIARALSEFVALFTKDKAEYVIRPTSEISLVDLRGHPVVVIGANDWSQRLVGNLRYRFSEQSGIGMEIYDSSKPSTRWARSSDIAYDEADDYAVVARFRNELTDNLVVVASGIGKNGTEAAAQFITSSRYLELLDTPQSKDWAIRNVEFVIRTRVVNGKAGAPSLEAVHTW